MLETSKKWLVKVAGTVYQCILVWILKVFSLGRRNTSTKWALYSSYTCSYYHYKYGHNPSYPFIGPFIEFFDSIYNIYNDGLGLQFFLDASRCTDGCFPQLPGSIPLQTLNPRDGSQGNQAVPNLSNEK